jgi:hypothetical protein
LKSGQRRRKMAGRDGERPLGGAVPTGSVEGVFPKGANMKSIAAIACMATVALAGCATTGTESASYDQGCKLGPVTYSSTTGLGKQKPVSSLDQAYAQMQLGTSDLRYRELVTRAPVMSNTESVMQGCRLPATNDAT